MLPDGEITAELLLQLYCRCSLEPRMAAT